MSCPDLSWFLRTQQKQQNFKVAGLDELLTSIFKRGKKGSPSIKLNGNLEAKQKMVAGRTRPTTLLKHRGSLAPKADFQLR